MGRFNSSKTRVAPFFDALIARDPSGWSWVPQLLGLPEHGSGAEPQVLGDLQDYAWGENERALPAPRSLLEWLIRNLRCPSSMKADRLEPEQRRDLVRGDEDRIAEGIELLDTSKRDRGWHVMEGPSYPDAYLATSDALVVVEGKRTEAGPTTSTTWMPVRLQMLRHLDAALDLTGPRALYGFFMVEGPSDGSIPDVWVEAARQTLDPLMLADSLPHRSEGQRRQIMEAFLGVTTWQRACIALDVPTETLVDEVVG